MVNHQSFKRHDKLIKTDEFSSVFDFKARFHSPYFVLHYKPNETHHGRLGLVVGRKVNKSAVKRNYMRRVLRELFRTHPTRMLLSYDLVLRVTRSFDQSDFAQIKEHYFALQNKLSHQHNRKLTKG